ncbi:MAG: hypothetical protein K0R46_265 [Herbinix sp.]|jgi:hypothetical protein|nr:hypothetical protein [Herbinix sp.]
MAKYERNLSGDYDEIVKNIHEEIMNDSYSMKLVDESNYQLGDINISVRVYDKYFMRNGNRTSLSLTIAGNSNDIYVSAISAGGGQGIFLDTSWGAEEDMITMVQNIIEQRV